MAVSRKAGFLGVVAMLVVAAVVSTWAQGLGPSSGGSLTELTAEVRQLRLAVQEAGRSQTQMQAVSIALTAQHSRLAQVGARLEAIEKELATAVEHTRAAHRLVTEAQNEARTASSVGREHWEGVAKMHKAQADLRQEAEDQIRNRQIDLVNAFRTEEARWIELVAKLDEIVKK